MNDFTRARRALDTAWRSFVLDGQLPQAVRPEVLRSWERAKTEWRIDPGVRACLRAVGSDDLQRRIEHDEVFRAASPLLTEFAERLAGDSHNVAFVDADGVILSVQGCDRTRALMAEGSFAPGACWTEQSAATNAVGVALTEGRPVEVFASEHFVHAWQPWNCASVPVRSGGRIVGVVDITSPWTARHPSLLVCVEALAKAIEARLDAVAAHRSELLRDALGARRADPGTFAIDLDGHVIGGQEIVPAAAVVGRAEVTALQPLLSQLRRGGGRHEDFESTIEVGADRVRLVCTPVAHAERTIGALLRVSGAMPVVRPPRRRGRRPLYRFEDVLGESPALERAKVLARNAARNMLPVLVIGESGTGKELVAQAIHSEGVRAAGPFVALNCGAIPESLIDAELFGYEAGSFTGGRREGARGRIEDADGGTLFLDEVSELSPSGQTALLRALQEREITRLGSSAPRPVDFRLIAASNKDLRAEIQARRFREDLYYRLDVLRIELPPLRSRREDVRTLATHYLAGVQLDLGRGDLAFTAEALAALSDYAWPGNVRELKNVVERSAAGAVGPYIGVAELPPEVTHHGRPDQVANDSLAEAERAVLQRTLESTSWNVVRAAQALGMSRRTFYRRLEKHGLTRA